MVTMLSPATEPERFVGAYGQTWRAGVLSEHLDLFVRAGGVHRPSRHEGAGWAVIDGKAVPIVCSEVVAVATEDGMVSGRCGANALAETGACETHSEVLAHWRETSERERAYTERMEAWT